MKTCSQAAQNSSNDFFLPLLWVRKSGIISCLQILLLFDLLHSDRLVDALQSPVSSLKMNQISIGFTLGECLPNFSIAYS